MAGSARQTATRMVVLTLDAHLRAALEEAAMAVRRDLPGFRLDVFVASGWSGDATRAQAANEAIARADIVVAHMLFMEEHYLPVIDALRARRDVCAALVGCLSAGPVVELTKLGGFRAGPGEAKGPMAWLKRLKGSRRPGKATSGERQMRMLRRLPKLLRLIPGTAQDLRAYLLTLGYLLAGSAINMEGLLRHLLHRYAGGVVGEPPLPREYPETALYHPRLPERIGTEAKKLPRANRARGRVGLLLMRSYVLSGDTGHYDGVIAALEAAGLDVVPAFAAGLDSRPAVERFFQDENGAASVDAVVSLTGFSLVGGPAYNDAGAAVELLKRLDVPYVAGQVSEFQTLGDWRASPTGLTPVEQVMSLAIPELDGAIAPVVVGGRDSEGGAMAVDPERTAMLAARVAKMIALRRTPVADRRLAITLFSYPPNAGAVGTAAFLSVFESLWNVLAGLKARGYAVDLPEDRAALEKAVLEGNAAQLGTPANVFARVPAADHIAREPHLAQIESQWGPAPGRQQSDGSAILLTGARFGNVLVGVQPDMGYEGDPMRLLFEGGFAPTHAFSAYYRHLREDFGADALLHFGTHGALEFMPGKQAGLTGECWPDRLIGDLPHYYLYAANNPSEASIAKRRSGAVTLSHMTPPLAQAGLYNEWRELKASLERWHERPSPALAEAIQAQAASLDLAPAEPQWTDPDAAICALGPQLAEMEATVVPRGLHVVGRFMPADAAADLAALMAEAQGGEADAITQRLLANDELGAVLTALDGGYVAPVAGGDMLADPDMLPTGRNIHGFDPFRLPATHAAAEGAAQAQLLLDRALADDGRLPESIGMVLWGTDTLKSGGVPVAQVLALMGARARFDGFGRLAGAELIPLADLDRPRIDVIVTLSGIFRDLLPLQSKLIAEAAWLAAQADEPVERNFIRKHALAQVAAGVDPETAALRVFSNAEGAYGANVNHLVENSLWEGEDELAATFAARKGFAYGRDGRARQHTELLGTLLQNVDCAYQNLESAELGITTIDHYFDSLGGMARAAGRGRARPARVYVGDRTGREAKVRTMTEQVALETRTRALNPGWYEAMLEHGREGVAHIEASVTNTFGWSATTGQVEPWVYQKISQTFVLDEAMRRRLAQLNPTASARMANRLLEASDRRFWTPDAATLAALEEAGDELNDRMEGIAA
ncbi:cobaltochelatase subunit CobN [Erythrobacter sp. LQ02-29]|uniref:cobaltochelatase subunit CobN n=1 Tax=Erythrobacter sp. LQ02-29 TaxID=2920384 RepID=UPI001F4EED33|nr:cobaltochelatase subunit CobN [Erythrobacter sp. LQ02-29]MCP9223833.1 cobaltochelatase subunit CobN [Erythrobacter sp. LQ02-29]